MLDIFELPMHHAVKLTLQDSTMNKFLTRYFPVSMNDKRYVRQTLIASLIYVAMVYVSISLLKTWAADWPMPIRAFIALSPVVPMALFCKAFIVYLNACDELVRRIELEAVSISTMLLGLGYLALGLLGRSGIVELDGVTVAIWVFPLMCLLYMLGRVQAALRYQ